MTHLIDGEFQSDKYPTCPRGKVPLSCKDPMAQDLLWEYAQRRRLVDPEFSQDLETALLTAAFPQRFADRPKFPGSAGQRCADAVRRLDGLIQWFDNGEHSVDEDQGDCRCEERVNILRDLADVRRLLVEE